MTLAQTLATAALSGAASAIGSYVATRTILHRIERALQRKRRAP